MKFKKLRKILGEGKIIINKELERSMIETTTDVIIYDDISIVPDIYDDYEVVDIDAQVRDGVYNEVTIRMDTSDKKFGELRRYIQPTDTISIALRSTTSVVVSYCLIGNVPTEYNEYKVIDIRSVATETGCGHELKFYLDDTK